MPAGLPDLGDTVTLTIHDLSSTLAESASEFAMDQSSTSDDTAPTSGKLNNEPRSQARVILSAWLCSGAMIAYLCRNSLGVAEKTIRLDLKISEESMGFIMGSFFWAYALCQIPGGLLGKKFGSRTWVPIFSAASAIATMAFGMATGVVGLLTARIGIGVAQAGLFPCSTIAITKWFPKGERGLASGFLAASMPVGGAIGLGLTGELLEITSWRWTLILYSIPGLLWAVGFRKWFRETPSDHHSANQAECDYIADVNVESHAPMADTEDSTSSNQVSLENEPTAKNEPVSQASWLFLAARLSFWMICSQQFFRAAGAAFFQSWFPTYLQETRGVSTAKSGWLSTLPLIATVVAAILAGGLSDFVYRKTKRLTLARSGLAGGALFLCSVLVFSAWFVKDATTATLVISGGAFFAAVAGPCAYASTMDMGGRNVSLVFSWMNMIGNFGAALVIWGVPYFRKLVEKTPALLDLCGGNSWNAILILFGTMFLMSSACWTMLRVRENELES
jgi:sugar phosphate permease